MRFIHRFLATVKQLPKKQKIIWATTLILVPLLALCIMMLVSVSNSVGKSFKGNAFSALTSNDPLQQNGDITSMLIFGNSSDDPGHGGKLLTDSIMVLSINHKTKKTYTVSIPRDLWVQYGKKCSNGTEGKINAVYQCEMRYNNKNEHKAAQAFSNTISQIVGVPIHYYAKVNYTFVRDSVNALGGVDVVIQSDDPRGIMDRSFDKNCPDGPYTCYNLKYENGPVHLNGQQALNLSRARNAEGGYGLPRSNFDRELNQQMIVEAIQQKALSAGVLTNPIKMLGLVESLGDNVLTNIPTNELQSAMSALKNTAGSSTSIHLNDQAEPLVTTGMQGGQSIVLPTAGLYDYSAIQSTVRGHLDL